MNGPISTWLKNRKPLLGKKTYKVPIDYIVDLQDLNKELTGMIASLGNGTATEDERKQLEQAQSHVRSALRLFEDAQQNIDAAW